MDKNILKSFAINSRKELLEKIKVKAQQYGIKEDSIEKPEIIGSDSIVINGQPLSREENIQREKLIERIEYVNDKEEDGYNAVIEEVAYTWFNRFTALRFMEVNNYLPTRVRVLSSSIEGSIEPDIVREANSVNLSVDKKKIYEMKLDNDMEGLFKYMIIAQCNALNEVLPFMFEEIGHYTELLFPDGLLNGDSFVRNLTNTDIINEEDWKEVEILGWFYQYYNSEEKDRVYRESKKHSKEDIPLATQLFTPNWIVRYMVQNSLGRYWLESHKEHSGLKQEWEFYIENPNPEPNLEEKLAPYINKELNVEDIKCFDPACGSGHILVYMFDLLYQIYEKCGYTSREIPRLIIEKNLYGLDIDDRAHQLSCFAVIMQGMKYNNRLLRSIERETININIASIQESNGLNDEDIAYIAGELKGEKYDKTKEFIEQFKDAKIYGSLIKLKEFNKVFLEGRCDEIYNNPAMNLVSENSRKKVTKVLYNLIKQANIMNVRYDILVMNPPYTGIRRMNNKLYNYLKDNYIDSKEDMCTAFMEIDKHYLKSYGFFAMVNQHSWMFTSSFEELRKKILNNNTIYSMLHLGARAFEEIAGEVVQTTAFVLRNLIIKEFEGTYLRLVSFNDSKEKKSNAIKAINHKDNRYLYRTNQIRMKEMIGYRIGYWLSDDEIKRFKESQIIYEIATPCTGMQTGGNSKYIREWFEINNEFISFNNDNNEKKYWIPYQMGGKKRKWYGNVSEVIYWKDDGYKVKSEKGSVIRNKRFYFKKGMSWKRISSGSNSIRILSEGFIFDQSADSIFVNNELDYNYLLSFLNTKIVSNIFDFVAPTLNLTAGTVKDIPIFMEMDRTIRKRIDSLSEDCISISRNEWNSMETSWDFSNHPILEYRSNNSIENAYKNWCNNAEKQFNQLKANEEELNSIFIKIYALKDEISSEVEEESITIRRPNKERDIKSFISYAVGCIFGRYSLDEEGLIYAGGEFNPSKYTVFKADEDNIIPILSDSYFEDDIVTKFIEFVRVTFGTENLSENLNFIAETLGKRDNEADRDTIRRYFVNDFFKDHCQIYKNRPIYWLFTSGKQKAFNCLIYMHRYDESTLSTIRTDYLHELQDRLDTERKSLIDVIEGDYETKERNDAKKKMLVIDRQIKELNEYDEVLHHMADKHIEIDLDDGVVANYTKFKGLVSKIK